MTTRPEDMNTKDQLCACFGLLIRVHAQRAIHLFCLSMQRKLERLVLDGAAALGTALSSAMLRLSGNVGWNCPVQDWLETNFAFIKPKNRLLGAPRKTPVEKSTGETTDYNPRRLTGVSVYREVVQEFSAGDRIQFTAPDKPLGVANRDLAVIESVSSAGLITARRR
jgi:hypothetical protein